MDSGQNEEEDRNIEESCTPRKRQRGKESGIKEFELFKRSEPVRPGQTRSDDQTVSSTESNLGNDPYSEGRNRTARHGNSYVPPLYYHVPSALDGKSQPGRTGKHWGRDDPRRLDTLGPCQSVKPEELPRLQVFGCYTHVNELLLTVFSENFIYG